MKPSTLALSVAVLSFACASTPRVGSTGYQPRERNGDGYGYANSQLDQRTFQIYFAAVSEIDAREGAMIRAAEVTAQMGFDGFVIAANDEHAETKVRSRFVVGRVRRQMPTVQMTIVCFRRQDFAVAGAFVHDARGILQQHPELFAARQ